MFTSLRHNKDHYTIEVRTDVFGDEFPRWRPLINIKREGDTILFRDAFLKNCELSRLKMMLNSYDPSVSYVVRSSKNLKSLILERW